jgi:hypothetical protein
LEGSSAEELGDIWEEWEEGVDVGRGFGEGSRGMDVLVEGGRDGGEWLGLVDWGVADGRWEEGGSGCEL